MIKKQEHMSYIQLSALITSTIIGVIILGIPKLAVDSAKEGAVLSTITSGAFATVLAVMVSILSKRFYRQTIMEYSTTILGKALGKIYGFIILTYLVLICGVLLRNFSDALKGILLKNTPLEIIMISMLLVVVYLVQNGISAIARISETFLPIIILALLLVIFLSFTNFSMDKFRPALTPSLISSIKGVPNLMMAYMGFEVLFFVVPFMQDQKKIVPYTIVGMAVPLILYTLLVAIAFGVYGLKTTHNLIYPTITLAKDIAFAGLFADRFDILFVVLWILAAFTTITNYYYISSLAAVRLLGLKNYQPLVLILLPMVYILAILPQNILEIRLANTFIGYLGIGVILLSFPLLIISWLTGKREKKNA